jgi:hypothetical protein
MVFHPDWNSNVLDFLFPVFFHSVTQLLKLSCSLEASYSKAFAGSHAILNKSQSFRSLLHLSPTYLSKLLYLLMNSVYGRQLCWLQTCTFPSVLIQLTHAKNCPRCRGYKVDQTMQGSCSLEDYLSNGMIQKNYFYTQNIDSFSLQNKQVC